MSLLKKLQQATYKATNWSVDHSINEAPEMTPEEQRTVFKYFEEQMIQAAQNGFTILSISIFSSFEYITDTRGIPLLVRDCTNFFGANLDPSEEIVLPFSIRKWYFDIMNAIRGMNDEAKKLAIEKCNLMFMHFLQTLRDVCIEMDNSGVAIKVFDKSKTQQKSYNGPISRVRECGLEFCWKFPMTKEISDQTEVVRKREREYVDATMHLASLWESEIKKNCVANE
jgi:hypothetical protein